MNELFWAEKGKGCYLNDTRIRVAGRRDLSESLIATGLPFIGKTGHAQSIKDIHAIGQRVAGIRRLGSAALDFAWVACGRYDAYYERNLKPWDVAAGILFVTEAGGIVTTIDTDGDPKTGHQSWPPTPNCTRNCARCSRAEPPQRPAIRRTVIVSPVTAFAVHDVPTPPRTMGVQKDPGNGIGRRWLKHTCPSRTRHTPLLRPPRRPRPSKRPAGCSHIRAVRPSG